MEYFEKQYFRHGKTNWMLSERQGTYYGQINTNNFVEAWHRTLKVKFFEQQPQKRVDRVIYILSQLVVPYFQKKDIETELGIGRLSKKQKTVWIAHDKASQHILRKIRNGEDTSLANSVSTTDTSAFEMASFTNPGKTYTITTKTGEPRDLVQEALQGATDAVVEQQVDQAVDEATGKEETHPNQEVGDHLNEISTLASSVNWKARLTNRDSMIASLKRTRDSLKEGLEGAPEHRFSTHGPRRRRYA
ncbi:hypothetical protein BGX34_008590 [Mortierella sp. NVP85]|nr:hypothetical protein BGX34_008590 [Mortierella sp. NVP85]